MKDKINKKMIRGKIEIINGDRKIVAYNKPVEGLAMAFKYMLTTSSPQGTSYDGNEHIKIGSDTTTPTTLGMTDLVNIIDSKSPTISSAHPTPGHYIITHSATWDAGTVSGTIGEVGIHTTTSTFYLLARSSVADGDFQAFTIDESKPLTVNYIIEIDFTS